MLDSETKARIDSARDILVGKVPDPKSQVEQITIALIYKFMDDMDRQSEELGGKASFFTGEFKKYRWSQLLDKRLGGHERLLLYAEGIEKMNEHAAIPQLFRDIFRGVFLPYRDPETLNLFLKEINGFTYDHSERLGDAFEYLLSVLGTQGNAGQFRTPRHIIDFIAVVVDPRKHETVLDPACGTAGFLIAAYKHILGMATRSTKGTKPDSVNSLASSLSPDERARLMTNFAGYDIAPDMVRLSRVNMYLHGFPNPTIHEYDALTSEERWDERFDIIMANPPFMSPKGGIRPHNRFAIKAKRSEVLFVDYIAEHLNPGGRAGIIVPEGIIFQSQNAYKNLRRMLVENFLWAVVSLPAGVFNPYSGVKTSILFLDKNLAKRADDILFVKITNDGFDLGAQRRPIEGGELPEALRILHGWKTAQSLEGHAPSWPRADATERVPPLMLTVSRTRLLESPDCNLSGERHRITVVHQHGQWPMATLADIAEGKPQYGSGARKVPFDGEVRYVRITDIDDSGILKDENIVSPSSFETTCVLREGDLLFARSGSVGRTYLHEKKDGCYQYAGYLIRFKIDTVKAIPRFVFYVAHSDPYWKWIQTMRKDGTISNINATEYGSLQIPLPPLEEQERIVAELDGYRKVIEGARQVVENYKPSIQIDPAWPVKSLGEIAKFRNGINYTKKNKGTGIKVIGVAAFQDHLIAPLDALEEINPEGVVRDEDVLKNGDILFVRSNGNPALVGRSIIVQPAEEKVTHSAFTIRCRLTRKATVPLFCAYLFKTPTIREALTGRGANISNLSQTILRDLPVPLPPEREQEATVKEMEAERAIIESNRKLIDIFEKKIQTKLAEVWGETKD